MILDDIQMRRALQSQAGRPRRGRITEYAMPGISPRNPLASWLRGMRATMENLSDNLQRSRSRTQEDRSDPLASVRCVWYGRAMFCLYLPDPDAPEKSVGATASEHPGSDLYPGSQLDHAIVRELEKLDRTSGVAAHRGE